jgi:hypothetical protein
MKRLSTWSAAALAVLLVAPAVSADVKTREKTTFALEGVLGGVVRIFGGRAAREGVESTTAVKGDRKLTVNNTTGRILDLGEEKAYDLDVRRKEYTVVTFAQLRAQFEQAKADAKKRAESAPAEEKEQMQEAGRQLEFDVKVDETGQKKSIAGYDTREVILTVAGREKGKTLEESGGFVLTNTMWLAPRITALDELYQFELRAAKAIYGADLAADMQQMAGMMAAYPAFAEMARRMQAEGRKLQGTALSTSTVFEGVKSAEQMKAAGNQQSESGGGGLTGRLGRRLMGNRGEPQARSKVLTTTHELLSVGTSVTDVDVALPAGYKEKK